jgi:uncharacterized protein (TIGR02145 family)
MINTVCDIDGNIYNTTKIGNQEWMTENLRVTKYNNGDPINIAIDRYRCEIGIFNQIETVAITEEIESKKLENGFYYNSLCISERNDIAPTGWRLPSKDDWEILIEFCGGKEIAAEKLKSEKGWKREINQPSTYNFKKKPLFGGNNQSGFNAKGSGKIFIGIDNIVDVDMYGHWWYLNWENNEKSDFGRVLMNYINHSVSIGEYIKYREEDYVSIRCVKII